MYKLNINRKISSVAIFEGQNIGWLAYMWTKLLAGMFFLIIRTWGVVWCLHFKECMSDSVTNYNYVEDTKISVSIKTTNANKCTLSEILLTEILKKFSAF